MTHRFFHQTAAGQAPPAEHVMPRGRPSLRTRWRNAPWWQRMGVILGTGILLLPCAFVAVFVTNCARVVLGDASAMTMGTAWASVNLDSVAAAGMVAADTMASVPPILDSLASAWRDRENTVYPYLILRATPLPGGDVAIVLNPVFYHIVTPRDQAARVAEMREAWRFILANSGVPWPTDGTYPPPQVFVYRLIDSGPPAHFELVTFHDSTARPL